MSRLASLAALSLSASLAQAAVINVPVDKPTIQSAIAAAQNGDQINVAPGTYYENLNFLGKAVAVIGTSGARKTIIDANHVGTVVVFADGETSNAVLKGFTIRNGYASFVPPNYGDGGGIYVYQASPTIDSNIVESNWACAGAGIAVEFASPRIVNNRITGNEQQGCSGGTGGGGILIGGAANAVIEGNDIENNSMSASDGGGIAMFAAGTPTIISNVIRGNSSTYTGGGLSMFNFSDAKIVNNLIVGNSSGQGGGVAFLVPGGSAGPTMINNTIADNRAPLGSEIYTNGFNDRAVLRNNIIAGSSGSSAVVCDATYQPVPPKFSFNDIYTSMGSAVSGACATVLQGQGNLSVDARFLGGRANNAYQLGMDSPAIDVGSNAAAGALRKDLAGRKRIADGNGDGVAVVDMGAYESRTP